MTQGEESGMSELREDAAMWFALMRGLEAELPAGTVIGVNVGTGATRTNYDPNPEFAGIRRRPQ